jgi:hypothetical protein
MKIIVNMSKTGQIQERAARAGRLCRNSKMARLLNHTKGVGNE